MQKIVKSILVTLVVASCIGCTDNGVYGFDESPYKVTDTKIFASLKGDENTYWLDNNHVLFQGHSEDYKPPERHTADYQRPKLSILIYDIKTGSVQTLVKEAKLVCFNNGTLFYSQDNKKNHSRETGILKLADVSQRNGRFSIKPKNEYPFKDFWVKRIPHCSVSKRGHYSQDVIADLKHFDAELRKVWLEDRELTEAEKRSSDTRYEIRFFSEAFPEGKLLDLGGIEVGQHLGPSNFQYVPHKDKYLFFVRSTNRSPSYRPKHHFLLSNDGAVEKLKIPEDWSQAIHIKVTAVGIVVVYGDMRKEIRKAHDRGAFLLMGKSTNDVIELLSGYVKALSLSPDGCSLATAHFPKHIALKPNNQTLKIINLCNKESEL